MKNFLILLTSMVTMLIFATACSTNIAEGELVMAQSPSIGQFEYTANIHTESNSSPICHDRALYLFEALNTIVDADGGELWGATLHGPIVFADVQSRYAVANMPDASGEIFARQGDVYVGVIPEYVPILSGNSEFGDTFWAVISWTDVGEHDSSSEWLMALMLHKLFHTRQHDLFTGAGNWGTNDHMEALDASISGRLEMNALLHALRSTGMERLISIHNALSIRYDRRYNNNELATNGEIWQEILEGTVTYTEVMLLFDNTEDRLKFIERAMHTTQRVTLFGYWTGALYGLLLDELNVDWRTGLTWHTDLAKLLQDSIDFGGVTPISEIGLERYGYFNIRLVEEARVAEIERMIQEVEEQFSGSLLLINVRGEFVAEIENTGSIRIGGGLAFPNFDEFDYGYEEIHPMFGQDTFIAYGDFDFIGNWGILEVRNGFLGQWHLILRHSISAEGMVIDGNVIKGTNWVLTLNDGFELREVGGGHFGIRER